MTESTSTQTVLACAGLRKSYQQGQQELLVLKDVNLAIESGERVAVIGQSGSGKSTLLNLLGGLDQASAGTVHIDGEPLKNMNERDRGRLRNSKLGFVYQFHHLMMEFTATENVAMPLLIRGDAVAQASDAANKMLSAVGLADRGTHKPAQLSGGERQRVAIARALVTLPRCVLMDEPTGNLDQATAEGVQNKMADLNAEFATSFVVVTHDVELAQRMDRVLELRDGVLHDM